MTKPVAGCVISIILASLAQATAAEGAESVARNPAELHAALNDARPGDTILLAAGEWRDARLRIRAEGTADAPVTVRAERPGETVLVGASSLAISGRFVVVDGLAFRDFADAGHLVAFRTRSDEPAEDCRLTNVSIRSPLVADGDADRSAYWVSVYGRRNRVDHCYLEGKRTSAPTLTVWVNADGGCAHRIDHNRFAGRPPLGKNGGETIRVGTSEVSMASSRTVVEHNWFERCDGESEIISNKSCDNVYRHNVFVECRGGLVLRHGNRCLVDGNWFFGNGVDGTGGIRVIGEDHRVTNNYLSRLMGRDFESAMPFCDGIPDSPANGYFQVRRAVVAHNTIVDCAQPLTFGVGHGARNRVLPAQEVIVANNLIAGEHGPLVRLQSPADVRWDGNVVWGAETGVDVPESGVRRADPMLARGNAEPARPAEQSRARAAAVPLDPPVTTDIAGNPRPATGADVGCFQHGAPATPPARDATGPTWMRD